jgi:response regulator NasT
MATEQITGPGRESAPRQAERDVSKLPVAPTTLLVADDEHLVATGIASNLAELGYQVIGPAADGEEVVQLCQTTRPDMAVLDIRMPRMDGLAAAEAIFRLSGTPSIILSAYAEPEYVSSAKQKGIFGYLLKPVTQDQLRVGIPVAWSCFLDYARQHSEIDHLKDRLENRKIVEQAKWVLVKRKGLDEPEAMRTLQRQARNHRRPLVDVARSILESEELL